MFTPWASQVRARSTINISLAVQTLAFSEGLLLAELGYAHRDLAALHEVLARTAPETSPTLPRGAA